MKTYLVFIFRRRLHQDKYIRLSHTSSEDVFKMSWSRPKYLSWLYVFKTSSRRFQDFFKVFKMSYKSVFKTSSRRFIFKTSCQDVFKTASKGFQDVLQRHLQDRRFEDVTSSRRLTKISSTRLQDVSSS